MSTKTDLLSVSLYDQTSSTNNVHKIGTNDASILTNSPVTSGAFYAKWECIFFDASGTTNSRLMVKITEFYPVQGRVWYNHYNWTKWAGWYSDYTTISSFSSAKSSIISSALGKALGMTSSTTIADVASKIAGVTNRGAVTGSITTSGGTYTIPAGYHNGSGKVTGPTFSNIAFYSCNGNISTAGTTAFSVKQIDTNICTKTSETSFKFNKAVTLKVHISSYDRSNPVGKTTFYLNGTTVHTFSMNDSNAGYSSFNVSVASGGVLSFSQSGYVNVNMVSVIGQVV